MSEKIKKSDISDEDIYGFVTTSAKNAEQQIKKLNNALRASAKLNNDALKKNGKLSDASEIKATEQAIKNSNTAYQKKLALEKEAEKIAKLREKSRVEEIRLEQAREKNIDKFNKKIADQNNAYKKLVVQTRDLKNESKRLGAELLHLEQSGKKNTKEFALIQRQYRQTTAEAVVLDGKLKKLDSRVGDNFRNVGNYSSAIGKLRSGLAQLGLAFGIQQVVRGTFNVIKDFDQGMANLSSVLGKTREQITKLEEDAKRLGSTTRFTATQVSQLQTEFAKLGFNEQEILNATESTLALAGATGTDLARSAEVAGSTLRALGLDAKEMPRVVDVMAKSFSTSALDTEKFAESMKIVAPIAKAAGVSLEETTAMLGALANAGISGSMAGTSMRQILSEMDKTGKSTSEALADLSKKGLNLADAEDEVGKNAKSALLVLLDQQDTVKNLTKEYQDAEGSAKAMADTQLNTLGGAIDLLSSAVEGYVLGLNDATGAGSKFATGIKFLAENIGTIINTVVKLGIAFLTFKGIMKGMQLVDQYKNWKSLKGAIAETGTATTEAGEKAKGFGNALKAIGITVAIGLLTELAMQFYDVASGTAKAREEYERYQKSLSQGEKFGQESVQRIKDKFDVESKSLELQLAKGKITEAQYKAEMKALNELIDAQIKGEIQLANEMKANAKLTGDNAIIAKENATLKELIALQKERQKASIDVQIADLNEAKTTKESTKATKDKTKALKNAYEEYLKVRVELTREEYTPPDLQFADIEEADNRIKERRRSIAEIKVIEAELSRDENKIREARIEQIKENLAIELENVELTEVQKLELKKRAELDIANLEREANKQRLETLKEFVDASADYFIKRSEEKIEQIDKEIAAAEKQADLLQELAKNGNLTAQQSLAEQQRIINDANRQKLAEQKRIERIKLAETAFGVYSSKLDAGDKTPLLSTIKDITLLNQFIASLPAFESGTENTGANGKGLDGKGGFLSVLHPYERVVDAENNANIGNLSNDDLSNIAKKYNTGQLVEMRNIDTAGNSYDLLPLLSEIKELKRTIENRPTHNIAMGEITQSIMQIVEKTTKGNRVERKIYNIRK